jgi:hypothetical protein
MPYVTGKRLGSKRRAFVGIKYRRTDGPNPTFGSFISWSRCNARRGRRIQVIRAGIPLVHTLAVRSNQSNAQHGSSANGDAKLLSFLRGAQGSGDDTLI